MRDTPWKGDNALDSGSSYGYNLLRAVLEGASDRPFLTLMQERVFGPRGMRQTVPEHVDSLIPFRARFYTRADTAGGQPGDGGGGIINAPWVDNSYKWAGGGFLSTTEDLAAHAGWNGDRVWPGVEHRG